MSWVPNKIICDSEYQNVNIKIDPSLISKYPIQKLNTGGYFAMIDINLLISRKNHTNVIKMMSTHIFCSMEN